MADRDDPAGTVDAMIAVHGGGDVEVRFGDRITVDVPDIALRGATVRVNPADPAGSGVLHLGDLDESAMTVVSLFGRPAMTAVRGAAADLAATGEPVERAVPLEPSAQWAALGRLGLVRWLRDFCPDQFDAQLLDIDQAAAADMIGDHLTDDDADAVWATWTAAVDRIIELAARTVQAADAQPSIALIAGRVRDVVQATARSGVAADPGRQRDLDEVTDTMRDLAALDALGPTDITAAAVEVGVARLLDRIDQELRGAAGAPRAVAAALGGPGVTESPNPAAGAVWLAGGVDWRLVDHRLLDDTESAVRWSGTPAGDRTLLAVEVLPHPDAVRLSLWSGGLAVRVVAGADPAPIAVARLIEDQHRLLYRAETTLPAGVDLRAVRVDVFSAGATPAASSVPAAAVGLDWTAAAARRQAGRALALERRATLISLLLHGQAPDTAGRDAAEVSWAAAATAWTAARHLFRQALLTGQEQACRDRGRRLDNQDVGEVAADPGPAGITIAEWMKGTDRDW